MVLRYDLTLGASVLYFKEMFEGWKSFKIHLSKSLAFQSIWPMEVRLRGQGGLSRGSQLVDSRRRHLCHLEGHMWLIENIEILWQEGFSALVSWVFVAALPGLPRWYVCGRNPLFFPCKHDLGLTCSSLNWVVELLIVFVGWLVGSLAGWFCL